MSQGNNWHVVTHFPDEPAKLTFHEGVFSSTLHAFWNSSGKSNSMTSPAQDQASHVTSNSWSGSKDYSSKSPPACQSEIFWDEDVARNQSKEQSSNGVSNPAHDIFIGPNSMSMPTSSARMSGVREALQPQEITTFMVQNLPRQCPPAVVAAELDRSGFAGGFDFVYVPTMFKPGRHNCYAFVNFISAEVAMKFQHEWKRSWRFLMMGRRAKVNVVPARIQGLQANVAKWGEHAVVRVKNPDFRPLRPWSV